MDLEVGAPNATGQGTLVDGRAARIWQGLGLGAGGTVLARSRSRS